MASLHPGLLAGQDLLLQRGGQVWRRSGRRFRAGSGRGRGGQEREHRPQGGARTLHHDALLLCLQVDSHQRSYIHFRYKIAFIYLTVNFPIFPNFPNSLSSPIFITFCKMTHIAGKIILFSVEKHFLFEISKGD